MRGRVQTWVWSSQWSIRLSFKLPTLSWNDSKLDGHNQNGIISTWSKMDVVSLTSCLFLEIIIFIRNYDLNQTAMFSWFIYIYNRSLYLNPNPDKILSFDWLTPRRDNDDFFLNAKKNVLNLKQFSRNQIQSNHVTHYQMTLSLSQVTCA